MHVRAECGACNPTTHFACASRNKVHLCTDDNLPTKASFDCPSEHVCLSSSAYPCVKRAATYDCEQTCSDVCSDDIPPPASGPFSQVCSGPSTFILCGGGGLSFNLTCPSGQVCIANNGNNECASSDSNLPMCPQGDISTSTSTPSTGTTSTSTETPVTVTTTTTTSQVPLTPDEICAGKPNQAKYPLSPPDPFCERYVWCRLSGGVVRGALATCPSKQLFNAPIGVCERGTVDGCRTY